MLIVTYVKNIPEGDESHRLAMVNMDWDFVNAMDILKVIEAFKPQASTVNSVTIYTSQFGKERLAQEEIQGPSIRSARFAKSEKNGKKDSVDRLLMGDEDEDDLDERLVRKYQLERLRFVFLMVDWLCRYYFAIIECDSVETARAIYTQCDGAEFERSSVTIDLRFVPDDVVFDEEDIKWDFVVKLICLLSRDCVSESTNRYKPKDFVSSVRNGFPLMFNFRPFNTQKSN